MKSYRFKVETFREPIKKYVNHLRTDANEFILDGFEKNEDDEIELNLMIPIGKTEIEFKSHKFIFDSIEYEDIHGLFSRTAKHEELFLTILCDSRENAYILCKEFIKEVIEYNKNKIKNKVNISIYKPGIGWIILSQLPKRNMDTIYLESTKKDAIIKDIENFYNNEKEYHKFGIPHTRKYLLVGPPGTGKTSFIMALASLFDKSISMISFNQKLDDAGLMNIFNQLENDSFLVLEDIDALFINSDERSLTNSSAISFSGLLNVLDGFGRKEKIVILMTTNHMTRLDEALIRPGRVDHIVFFENANEEQIRQMFIKFFPKQIDIFPKFYGCISHKKISLALLQKFFFDNRECPDIYKKISDLNKLINIYTKEKKDIYI